MLQGILPFTKRETDMSQLTLPRRTRVSLILGNPDEAFALAALPVHGVGLARLEFIVSRIGVHPRACLEYESMDASHPNKKAIRDATLGSPTPAGYYVSKIAEGVATIAAAFYPQPVIVRMSDFKTNEARMLSATQRIAACCCLLLGLTHRHRARARSTGGCWAARRTSPRRRTRCWASAARRATTQTSSRTRSASSALR